MKATKASIWAFVLVFVLAVSASAGSSAPTAQSGAGQIYLYGEAHGSEPVMDRELAIWQSYYQDDGMRHLFIEMPYYTAAFLNLWMQADTDTVLKAIYAEWKGTASHVLATYNFYKQIKETCPETIFHGTDVGHQYDTIGNWYLAYLESNGLQDSDAYPLAIEAIEQGTYFYENDDHAYRENKMAENFIRAFDALDGESIMGIYGSAHTELDAMDYATGSVPGMAAQLHARYGDALHTEDLSWAAKEIAPERVDTITVGGKDYQASYFGVQDLTGFRNYSHREFWRLEDAYDDMKDMPKAGDVLPYSNYPMTIETGQVFVIDMTETDGTVSRLYYRSDGNEWQGMPSTDHILPK